MHLYPQLPGPRYRALVADLASIILLVLFAWAGVKVHDAVDQLAVLGEGVQATGGAVQGGFESAADAVDGTPVIGDDLAEGLRGAGEGSGGEVSELGREGEENVHQLADILGLVTFALPALLLLALLIAALAVAGCGDDAGYGNIDIDTSTLVDLSFETRDEQQREVEQRLGGVVRLGRAAGAADGRGRAAERARRGRPDRTRAAGAGPARGPAGTPGTRRAAAPAGCG
jgi:hypothetical protein